ncbi:hypothetical protein [Agrococcus sp. KRD186]|uniref:hypothetical protein n=1 Tax=Agrococcus sp. KRD186 TaxID=2729730 RepID=UPI0019D19907|nr:hypothetical protein [Agrococcus sp. KRD186]
MSAPLPARAPLHAQLLLTVLPHLSPAVLEHPGSRAFRAAVRRAALEHAGGLTLSRRELAAGVAWLRRAGCWPGAEAVHA